MIRAPHLYWLTRFAIVSLIFIVLMVVVYAAFGALDSSEYGPIETAEHLILIASIVLWYRAAQHLSAHSDEARAFHPLIAWGFVVISYVALGRELSWLRVYGFSGHKLVEIVSAVLCLAALAYLAVTWFFRTKGWFGQSLRFMASPSFMFILICLILGLLGEAIEKKVIVVEPKQVFEESAELWGYIALIFAPLSALTLRRS
jgi:hypothetical protein